MNAFPRCALRQSPATGIGGSDSEEAVRDAIRRPGQFNIIHPASGLKIDVFIRRNTLFDRSRFGRVRHIHPAENYAADFAAPEDVN